MTTPHLKESIGRSPLRLGFLLIPLVLICFALSPNSKAVCQEGCLTNNSTVLGDDALLNNLGFYNTAIGVDARTSNTTGISNTATGNQALSHNTTANDNTATGSAALASNTIGDNNTATGSVALVSNNRQL